jgi:hypothetical protein
MEHDLKEVCDLLRSDIDSTAKRVHALKQHSVLNGSALNGETRSELFANVTLAYRHLEDARMRLGKVIQHYEGGGSKYDKPISVNP